MKFEEAKSIQVHIGETEYQVKALKTSYRNNNSLAVMLVEDNEIRQPFGIITVNLNSDMASGDNAFLDDNNIPEEVVADLEGQGLIKSLDYYEPSGFCLYPLYNFTELLKISYDED